MDDHETRIQKLEAQVAAQLRWFTATLHIARPFLPDAFVTEASAMLGPDAGNVISLDSARERVEPLPAADAAVVEAILCAIDGPE